MYEDSNLALKLNPKYGKRKKYYLTAASQIYPQVTNCTTRNLRINLILSSPAGHTSHNRGQTALYQTLQAGRNILLSGDAFHPDPDI